MSKFIDLNFYVCAGAYACAHSQQYLAKTLILAGSFINLNKLHFSVSKCIRENRHVSFLRAFFVHLTTYFILEPLKTYLNQHSICFLAEMGRKLKNEAKIY